LQGQSIRGGGGKKDKKEKDTWRVEREAKRKKVRKSIGRED